MVNNYPEYAAGVNFKKTDSNGVRHFYSAQVVADPSDETIESKLIKDGVVISEGGPTVEALNVTENGTYSEEGKAYSPVVVNVAGGSSDFSTAEVKFICHVQEAHISISYTEEADAPFMPNASAYSYLDLHENDEHTVPVILYKGFCEGLISPSSDLSVTATGDIEVFENEILKISGAGTITIDSAQA